MTRDEVRKLADLAGWTPEALAVASEAEWGRLMAFAALIKSIASEAMIDRLSPMIVQAEKRGAKEERQACAKVCESRIMGDNNREDAEAKRCAEAIRRREPE